MASIFALYEANRYIDDINLIMPYRAFICEKGNNMARHEGKAKGLAEQHAIKAPELGRAHTKEACWNDILIQY